jgi:hypothetical protein
MDVMSFVVVVIFCSRVNDGTCDPVNMVDNVISVDKLCVFSDVFVFD